MIKFLSDLADRVKHPIRVTFIVAFLIAVVVLNLAINSGNNIPMPSIYAVIGVIIYKYSLLILGIAPTKKV